MVAAGTRQLGLSCVGTVSRLRKMVCDRLKDLSTAGKLGSSFRREWLLSFLHDVQQGTNDNMLEMCETLKELASMSGEIADMELLLAPIRLYISKWAAMIGDCHWGGLLTVEMAILASITGGAVEFLGISEPNRNKVPHSIELCDVANNCRVSKFERRSFFLPVKAHLPSSDDDFRLYSISENSSRLWVGSFSVIRIILDGQHYEACTSPTSYPISPNTSMQRSNIMGRWFHMSDTLTEPYSTLTRCEEERIFNIEHMFEDMSQSVESSNHNEDTVDSFIDYTIYERGPHCIAISELQGLYIRKGGVVNSEQIMLSDDLVNCYMTMLEARSENISMFCHSRSLKPPPKTRYLDSSIFESAYRGLKGPASKKRRTDLAQYEQIVLPVLHQRHWVLGLILVKDETICVYDPFGSRREDVYDVLKAWAMKTIPL